MKHIQRLFLTTIISVLFPALSVSMLLVTQSVANQNTSDVLLAQVYQRGIDVQQYLVSEKFDGVRAMWDGKTLYTRTGRMIAAPVWLSKTFLLHR